MVRIGRTVLALEEPVGDALARIEDAPDERMPALESVPAPPAPLARGGAADEHRA